jgi:outer membrane protein assembly factor BamA
MNGRWAAFAVMGSVFCAPLLSPLLRAQSLEHVQRCLPYPTLAEEIREMRGEPASPVAKTMKIDAVRFIGNGPMSSRVRQDVVAQLRKLRPWAGENWAEEAAQIARAAWQDHGYFTSIVEVTSSILREDSTEVHGSVTLRVDQGQQYRLGELHFRSSEPDGSLFLSDRELRSLFPLRTGEIFSTERIRKGLEILKDRYGDEGYVDFTAVPLTDVDQARGNVSLTLELDEQRQYRIATVRVTGLSLETERQLKSLPKPGEVYRQGQIVEFYKQNKALLPKGIKPWNSMDLRRDVREGTLDLTFEFPEAFQCPQFDD